MSKTNTLILVGIIAVVIAAGVFWYVSENRTSNTTNHTQTVDLQENSFTGTSTSPTGRFVASETWTSSETKLFHLVDTTTNTDLIQKFLPEDASDLMVDSVVWTPNDSAFAFHSAYGSSDYPAIDAVYVYDTTSGTLRGIVPDASDGKNAGLVGYAHVAMPDATHVTFDKVSYQNQDNHSESTPTIMTSYVYDLSTNTLTQK